MTDDQTAHISSNVSLRITPLFEDIIPQWAGCLWIHPLFKTGFQLMLHNHTCKSVHKADFLNKSNKAILGKRQGPGFLTLVIPKNKSIILLARSSSSSFFSGKSMNEHYLIWRPNINMTTHIFCLLITWVQHWCIILGHCVMKIKQNQMTHTVTSWCFLF